MLGNTLKLMIHNNKLPHKTFILHPSNNVKYEISLCSCDNFILEIFEDSSPSGPSGLLHRLTAPYFVCGLVFSPIQSSIRWESRFDRSLTKKDTDKMQDTKILHSVTKLIRKIVSMNKNNVEIKVISRYN